MILYLIKSGACLLLLLLIYKGLLEREKMHRFNRYFLLLSLVLGLTIPLITVAVQAPPRSTFLSADRIRHLINQQNIYVSKPAARGDSFSLSRDIPESPVP